MKPPQDLPEDLARLLEKREKSDRRAPKSPGAAANKPPVERRKKTRRKP
jgi:hypothetical protein